MRLAVVDGVVVVTLVRPDGAEACGVVPPTQRSHRSRGVRAAPGRALKPRTLRMAGARVGRRSRKRAVHAAVSVLALISRHVSQLSLASLTIYASVI